jgi:dipeptidyl aminopeptidase/acylaminoacyl peptidase
VVLFIEPRGTAGQGWRFRSWANNKIGYWEPRDIVKVTEQWLENDFIDKQRTAVWGWSYGGFTTLKTLEYDGGNIFKYGMAVAPVTNWLFYDSIYTERYMNKPENNEEGYKISQISNVANLQKANRFLIMHGTADDNVHIQNTYSLLDLLDVGNVKNYDVHVFPDSEHSIYYHNANSIVYSKLSSWLKDAFYGDFDDLQHK